LSEPRVVTDHSSATREWDAATYHRVSDPQVAWGIPVLERLPLGGDETVIDAGCGTGRLTARLLERLPRGGVICVDRSSAMLRMARGHLEAQPNARVHYVEADLADLPLLDAAGAIFSTATFHWVRDHPRLFGCLFAALRSGGVLVAQCGGAGNLDRIRRRATEVMREEPYATYFASWESPWEYADAATTAQRLRAAGFIDIATDVVDAPVTLDGAAAYAEFTTAVILRAYVTRLPDETTRRSFVARMTELGAGDDPPFTLDYRRLNIDARRP
jgi:trans-aconitate 2-methyltransferase